MADAASTEEGGPPSDADVQLAARIRVAVARLARQLRQSSAAGMTPSQHSALTSVFKLEPVRLGELAAQEAVAPPTLTRIVAGLVELGMVERTSHPDDARSALVTTTQAGRDALQTVREERTTLLVSRLAQVAPAERSHLPELVALLEALVDSDQILRPPG